MAIYGPLSISSNLQLRLPVKLARELRVEAGDHFYARVSDDEPGAIVLLPAEVVERRYSAGERMEKAAQKQATELDAVEPDADRA